MDFFLLNLLVCILCNLCTYFTMCVEKLPAGRYSTINFQYS